MQLDSVTPPTTSLWRVHRDPTALPERPGPGETPANRFDDPRGEYRVRYLATSRRGAFLEVLARFRRSHETEECLQAVTEVDEDVEFESPASAPADFLASLRIVRAHPPSGAEFVDVTSLTSQSRLGHHLTVRQALDASQLGSSDQPAQLDEATIRLGGPRGRPITQAVSRVVFEETAAARIRYASRVDSDEECWAVFEATPLTFHRPEPVALNDHELRDAADQLLVALPST